MAWVVAVLRNLGDASVCVTMRRLRVAKGQFCVYGFLVARFSDTLDQTHDHAERWQVEVLDDPGADQLVVATQHDAPESV
jgi:hypothetical protein